MCAAISKRIISKVRFPKFFTSDPVWTEFKHAKLPIIWIIGPKYSGKSTIAVFLAEVSNFRLINRSTLSLVPNIDFVSAVKAELKDSFKASQGYIIHDFPANMKECKQFEKKCCKPSVVIYITLCLDAILSRALAAQPAGDINDFRVHYVKEQRLAEKVYCRYEKFKRAVKVFSQYPIQDTQGRVLDILETDFGYKFKPDTKITT